MSREQIEEMAKAIDEFWKGTIGANFKDAFLECFATSLYAKGIRKQSEGEWISNRQTDEYICSLCGMIAPVDCMRENFYKSNFCPNCGAKMKGANDE